MDDPEDVAPASGADTSRCGGCPPRPCRPPTRGVRPARRGRARGRARASIGCGPCLSAHLVILKPDAVRRGLVGEILSRFEAKGLSIVAMEHRTIDGALADEHYAEHVERDFYPPLRAFVTSGPMVSLVLEGDEAVDVVRALNGAPTAARPPRHDPGRPVPLQPREPRARLGLARVRQARDRDLVPHPVAPPFSTPCDGRFPPVPGRAPSRVWSCNLPTSPFLIRSSRRCAAATPTSTSWRCHPSRVAPAAAGRRRRRHRDRGPPPAAGHRALVPCSRRPTGRPSGSRTGRCPHRRRPLPAGASVPDRPRILDELHDALEGDGWEFRRPWGRGAADRPARRRGAAGDVRRGDRRAAGGAHVGLPRGRARTPGSW